MRLGLGKQQAGAQTHLFWGLWLQHLLFPVRLITIAKEVGQMEWVTGSGSQEVGHRKWITGSGGYSCTGSRGLVEGSEIP